MICQGPELTSQQSTERWSTYRKAIGPLGCGVDLVLQGQADAAHTGEIGDNKIFISPVESVV